MQRKLDPQNLIRPARFAHVVLRVSDLAASVGWYQQLIGADTVFGNDFVNFLTYDDEHHRIALIQTPVKELSPPGAPGLDHFAYTFNSMGALLSTYRRLERLGIQPVWCINHGPTTSFYYADPDSNRVELQYDNFPEVAELAAFLSSGAFKKNPIGVEFDAEKLVARYENGDSLEELIQQGSA